ncbi:MULTISPECIES: MFS transporter [unclassified Salinibacterium]|uniref:MFS transporter n=1 Tax=unclassified Salinibacterium TaxID=2632331 RepID=UPI0027D9FC99|nr:MULTISPECIES: MFS transporter [unclassified Salinibacterium]
MTQNSLDTPPPVWRAPGMPALLVLTAAGFGGFVVLIPVAPLWAIQGGATEAGSGLVNGLLLLVTVMTQPFVPRLLDHFGTGRVLAAGLVLLGAPPLLLLLSDQLAWILTISAVRGVGFGILTVTGSTVVANLVDRAQHGAAVGIYGAAIAIPQILLVPTATLLADSVGFWAVFALGALPLLGISSAPRLARILRGQAAERDLLPPTGSTPIVSTDGGKSQRRMLAISLLRPMMLLSGVTLAGGALLTFAPQMSSSPAATAGALALLTLSAAVTRWAIGGLSDRYGAHRFLWPLVVISVAGLLAIAQAVQSPDATGILLFLLGMTLVGIAYGGLQNLTLVISLAAVQRKQYGTASAVWNIGFDLGTALGSVLVGTLATAFGFPPAVLVAAAISLMTLPLAFMRRPKVTD